jgi:hypothetical protein
MSDVYSQTDKWETFLKLYLDIHSSIQLSWKHLQRIFKRFSELCIPVTGPFQINFSLILLIKKLLKLCMISGYSLLNDPEEDNSQLSKLILRINTNTWFYNLWSICNTVHYSHLAGILTFTGLCQLQPSKFSISQFFHTFQRNNFPPSCFIHQYSRINHITALPLKFLCQSKQVLKFVDSMGGIWMKSQLMKNSKLKNKSTMAFRISHTNICSHSVITVLVNLKWDCWYQPQLQSC